MVKLFIFFTIVLHLNDLQAKAIIANIFSSLHATMINTMKTCQNLLALASEASQQVFVTITCPFLHKILFLLLLVLIQ